MQIATGVAGRCALLAIAAVQHLLVAPAVRAGGPSVTFDFPRTIKCQETLSEETGRDERVVRCILPLSVRLNAGNIADVKEIRVDVADCDRRLRVHNFAPSTRLESTLAGNIDWSKTTETAKSFTASLGGEAPVPFGEIVAHVTPTASGGLSKRQVITEREQRLPPKQVVIASGTAAEGHGVFFTLRPTPQTSLEGMHQLTVEFVVPQRWRGDALHVSVEAAGTEKFLWITQQKLWAQKQAAVAIYLADDVEARQAAEDFIGE